MKSATLSLFFGDLNRPAGGGDLFTEVVEDLRLGGRAGVNLGDGVNVDLTALHVVTGTESGIHDLGGLSVVFSGDVKREPLSLTAKRGGAGHTESLHAPADPAFDFKRAGALFAAR